ncbi:MAG: hypothetical protein ACJA1B_000355 [Polaribacter sp.]|jgi:hypothetical protein
MKAFVLMTSEDKQRCYIETWANIGRQVSISHKSKYKKTDSFLNRFFYVIKSTDLYKAFGCQRTSKGLIINLKYFLLFSMDDKENKSILRFHVVFGLEI